MKSSGLAGILLGLVLVTGCGPGEGQFDDEEVDHLAAGLSASTKPGMGAVPYAGGTMFRVWAPGASRVFVAGDFNGWSQSATELGNEFNGNFSGDVAGAVAGQKYKFVIKAWWGETFLKSDPRSARVENSTGASIIHDHGSYWWNAVNFQAPPFNEQIIYEMHVGTYNDSPGFGPGNFQSVIARLDHLQNLGVNVIEILPVAEFPADFSWGFNPSFPFAPESAYGAPNDLKALVDGAHARGISVVLDVVHNHYGPTDLPMWCFTGDCLGSGGHYFYTDWKANTPWGNTRPDYGRNEVRDYIKDAAQVWLQEYRMDGLRWDATKYMRTTDGSNYLHEGFTQLQYVNNAIDGTQPWKIMIAEDFGGGELMSRATSAGGAGFDTQWDGGFVHPIRDAIITQNDSSRSMVAVRDAITHKFNGQATQRVIYTESHDEVANGKSRVPESIWPGNAGSWASRKRSTMGAALVMTSPGIPMLFQGQEFLEDGWFADSDPLDWSKAVTYGKITDLYRDLIRLRRNWFNNTRGLRGDQVNVHHVNDSAKVIAYHRWQYGGAGDDVVVLANFSAGTFYNYNVGMPRWGMWRVRFNSDWSGYSNDFANTATLDTDANGPPKDGMGQSANITVGAYSVVILSQ
jgi:1,4-alpha-glucan branching enzyme